MSKNIYDEDSIETLDPRNHVRTRSGMYIGSNENPNQLLLEVFSNALDEFSIGHGKEIDVSIFKDGRCVVEDYGQGFLVNSIRAEDEKTVLEASFSVMNTSGKYKEDGVYEGSSLGLNGLGSKLTNFLSLYLDVVTHRDGQYEQIFFKDGLFVSRDVGEWKDGTSGTRVEFKPDKQFFKSDKIDANYFRKFFNDMCCLCNGLTINLTTDAGIEKITKNGIDDFVSSRISKDIELISNRFILDIDNLKLGLTFTSSNVCNIISYVNLGLTEAGQHITTIKSSLTRVLNSWAKEQGILKAKDKNLDGASLQEGLLLVANITSKNVSYNSQTKEKIVDVDTSWTDEFAKQLEIWLDSNPDDGKIIIEKALLARKASEAAKKAREAVKAGKNKKDKVFNLPTSLVDCWTKDRTKAELLICEGKSAASGLVAARNSEYQAIYGIRGKCLSVLKTTPAKILANQEINNIIKALGLDCDQKTAKLKYDKNKLRYDKIIACADAK